MKSILQREDRSPITRLRELVPGGAMPELTLEDHRLLRFIGTVQFLAVALVLIAVLALPDPDGSDHAPFVGLTVTALICARVRWGFRRPSMRAARLTVIVGVIGVAATVAVARPVGPTPFLMLWPMLSTAYFLGRRELAGASVLMVLSLGIALVLNPQVGADFFLQIVPTTLVVAIASTLLVMLRERVDGLIGDLERTAATDGLTGLPNRSAWYAALEREIDRAQAIGKPLSVALFDLDRFKAINDCFGHAEGDRVLIRFGSLLHAECRSLDVPGRVGGEEFALLLAGAHAEGARAFFERLRLRLQEMPGEDLTEFTASSGVAEFGVHGHDIPSLMGAADRALYRAKAAGRDRCYVAEAPMVGDQSAEQLSESVTLKLEPQPQAATTLGFSTLNPAPVSASTKSIVDPST